MNALTQREQQKMAIGTIAINFASIDYCVGEMINGFAGAMIPADVDRLPSGPKAKALRTIALQEAAPTRTILTEYVDGLLPLIEERNNLLHGLWNLPEITEPQDGPAWLLRQGQRLDRPPLILMVFANETCDHFARAGEVFEFLTGAPGWNGAAVDGPHMSLPPLQTH